MDKRNRGSGDRHSENPAIRKSMSAASTPSPEWSWYLINENDTALTKIVGRGALAFPALRPPPCGQLQGPASNTLPKQEHGQVSVVPSSERVLGVELTQ